MDRKNAVLLLGPTGAGKTPLGNYLEENGLGDCRCVHFDFGENLRMVAGGGDTSLTLSERSFVQDVLERGGHELAPVRAEAALTVGKVSCDASVVHHSPLVSSPAVSC